MASKAKAVSRPQGLSADDKRALSRILKKARAFKQYYSTHPTVKKPKH